MLTTREVWFPLRSNLGLFEGNAPDLALEARVKQMALLADHLWFEPGIYESNVTEEGMFSLMHPPGSLSSAEIRARRESARKGESFTVSLTPEVRPGVVDSNATPVGILHGPLETSFLAEFHLLLEESRLGETDWAGFGFLPAQARPRIDILVREQRQVFGRDIPAIAENSFLDKQLKKDLDRDLAQSALTGIPAMVDELHQPLLEWKARHMPNGGDIRPPPGARALHLWAPNFSHLSWTTIIEVHDHDAIGAFREKLIEAEETVSGLPPGDQETALRDVGFQEVLAELRKRMTTWRDVGSELAASSLVDLIPYGGLIHTAAAEIAEVRRDSTSWAAVLLKLTDAD